MRGKREMAVLTWSHNRFAQLKKLWAAGLSASQIAAELGNVSRNAVIGKVHRLGLPGRAKRLSSAAPAQPAQRMVRVTRPIARGNTALAQAFEVEPDSVTTDNVVPMSKRLSLLELNEATCHWPIGDPSSPDFFFCGGKVLTGLPYCAPHAHLAYQQPVIQDGGPLSRRVVDSWREEVRLFISQRPRTSGSSQWF
jgi:GcrA cell cycle regulator